LTKAIFGVLLSGGEPAAGKASWRAGWENTMTKAELVSAIADKAGLNKMQARDALEAFVACVTASVKAGAEVRIVGFGSFTPVERKPGVARNPRTGEQIKRLASKTVRFRIGEGLKSALN
jgi:DNA-binding protein HU-beta